MAAYEPYRSTLADPIEGLAVRSRNSFLIPPRHAKKPFPDGNGFFCGYPQVLLSELPYIARKGECEGGTFDGFPRSRPVTRPQATDFAQQNRRTKKEETHECVSLLFWCLVGDSNPGHPA